MARNGNSGVWGNAGSSGQVRIREYSVELLTLLGAFASHVSKREMHCDDHRSFRVFAEFASLGTLDWAGLPMIRLLNISSQRGKFFMNKIPQVELAMKVKSFVFNWLQGQCSRSDSLQGHSIETMYQPSPHLVGYQIRFCTKLKRRASPPSPSLGFEASGCIAAPFRCLRLTKIPHSRCS